jgi:hypothetical protein
MQLPIEIHRPLRAIAEREDTVKGVDVSRLAGWLLRRATDDTDHIGGSEFFGALQIVDLHVRHDGSPDETVIEPGLDFVVSMY